VRAGELVLRGLAPDAVAPDGFASAGPAPVGQAPDGSAPNSPALADQAVILEAASIETYALAATGRTAEALARITEIEATVPSSANPPAAAHLRVNALTIGAAGGAWDEAAVEHAEHLARQAGDPGTEARLLLLQGLHQAGLGDYAHAEKLLAQAHAIARTLPTCFGAAEIYGNLALCLAYGDLPAAEALRRCSTLRDELADAPILRAAVGGPTALLLQMADQDWAADSVLAESMDTLSKVGHAAGLAGVAEFRSMVAELRGLRDVPQPATDDSSADDSPAATWFSRSLTTDQTAAAAATTIPNRPAAEAANQAADAYQAIGATGAAARCRFRAALLGGDAADGFDPVVRVGSGYWESDIIAGLADAVATATPAPLDAALARLADVTGHGARLVTLPSCLLVADVLGDADRSAAVQALLAIATAGKEVAG